MQSARELFATRADFNAVFDAVEGDPDEFVAVLDVTPPVAAWPQFARRLYHSPHLSNRERYTLLLFFLGNGVPPRQAVWLVYFVRNQRLDPSVVSQLAWILARHESGALWERGVNTFLMDHREERRS